MEWNKRTVVMSLPNDRRVKGWIIQQNGIRRPSRILGSYSFTEQPNPFMNIFTD